MTDIALSAEQIESFVEDGYVDLSSLLSHYFLYTLFFFSFTTSTTSFFSDKRIHLSSLRHVDARDFAFNFFHVAR